MLMTVMTTARSQKAAPIPPICPIRSGWRRCIKPSEVLSPQTISKFRGAGLKPVANASRLVLAGELLRRDARSCKGEHTTRQCQRQVAPYHVRASVDMPLTQRQQACFRWVVCGENLTLAKPASRCRADRPWPCGRSRHARPYSFLQSRNAVGWAHIDTARQWLSIELLLSGKTTGPSWAPD